MKVLLIGGGAREHALGWKLAQSPRLEGLLSVPGNPGLGELGPVVPGVSPAATKEVVSLALERRVDLVMVGPEDPLAAGLVDALQAVGVAAFGPTRSAARLESSKSYAKQVMARAGVLTAYSEVFEDRGSALAFLGERSGPYVVKADGLAGGKGVLVTTSRADAETWVERCLAGGFGGAGRRVLIEDYLEGPELSVIAVCAGEDFAVLAPARDYKRLRDGDLGPNTGGMGCYSPVGLPHGLVEDVTAKVISPVLGEMAADGLPYTGFLYAGLVLTPTGPQVLEFNCRLGDPEAQVILPRLRSDLLEVIECALAGDLGRQRLEWSEDAAVDVVLAATGYPHEPRTGDPVEGVEEADALVFHAGTALRDRRLVTSGGRVLNVVGLGPTLDRARQRAYAAAAQIHFQGMQYRHDIAQSP